MPVGNWGQNKHILSMQLIEGIKLDETNKEFNYAFELINYGHKLIYLTGRAGTGKTTFLKYLRESTAKNMVILAPTGVAAINAGGQTIHSFFQIDLSPYVPNDIRLRTYANPNDEDKSTIYDRFRYRKEKLEIIRGMDLLVIDEVSMVRCDLLDVIDVLLRVFRGKRNEPFGGVQVLLIGDTFQLPPVARPEVWEILEQFYKSPFFFSSKVIEQNKPIYIELKKVYRQHEQEFISLLNKVRVNEVSQDDLTLLNSRYNPSFVPKENDEYIVLATHNIIVNDINTTKLAELTSELHFFEAIVKGVFPDKMIPTEQILELKEGAQVMFVKNDTNEIKRYYNGKLAKIKKINEDTITVELSENTILSIDRQTWYNIEYTWNKEKKKIEEKVIGSFTQFPFKLAWAMSIHKSQGLTFDKVNADLGNAFAAGQVYVALSRCTTFNGLVLKTKIDSRDIIVSPEALSFAKNETPETLMEQELDSYKNSYKANSYYQKVRESLRKNDFNAAYDNLLQAFSYRNDIETDMFKRYFVAFATRFTSFKKEYDLLKNSFDSFKTETEANVNNTQIIENFKLEAEHLNNKVTELRKIKNNKVEEIENLKSRLDNSNAMIEQYKKEIEDLRQLNGNPLTKLNIEGVAGSLSWTLCEGVLTISGIGKMPSHETSPFDNFNMSIPWYAYRENIVTVIIGSAITDIRKSAFQDCVNLTFIHVDENNPNYASEDGVLFNKDKTMLLLYPFAKTDVNYIIPISVTKFGHEIFHKCTGTTAITIPKGITEIETCTFTGFAGLISIVFPDTLTYIGYAAFRNCINLTSINIPSNIKEIGSNAFENCCSLVSVIMEEGVESIREGAFSKCTNLISVIFPNSLKVIREYSFSNCINLPSVNIPFGITRIGEGAFWGCKSLTSITIPETVKGIGEAAFGDCENLQTVNYNAIACYSMGRCTGSPDDSYGRVYSVFPDCPSFIELNIGNKVEIIPNGAFYECKGLKYITIPTGVVKVQSGAFADCENLIAITLPNSIANIDESAFRGCDSLKHFYVQGATPPVVSNLDWERYLYLSDDIDKNTCMLHVPAGSKNQYANADYWKDFSCIMENENIDNETVERFVMYILNNGKVEDDTTIKEFLQLISNEAEYDVKDFVSKYPTCYAQYFPEFIEDEDYTVNMAEAVIEMLKKFSIEYDFLEPLAEGLSFFLKRFKELL